MEPQSDQPPLIAIVGETGSGKSALALEMAKEFGGEIIAADSRTLYVGMDIGTAKPTPEELQQVPHHLIDVTTPDKPITVAGFTRLAQTAIGTVTKRGRVPFLVGGTGLYVDSLLYGYSFSGKPDLALRASLQNLDVKQLQDELARRGIPLPSNFQNPRHLIRQIETGGIEPQPRLMRENTLVLAWEIDRDLLRARITERTDYMLQHGLEAEVRELFARYGSGCVPLQTIGYQEFLPYIDGKVPIEAARQAIITNTLQYAKRQRTWFRRNKSIHYIRKKEEAVDLITTLLNN